jgi:hypothetical protein
MIKTFSVKTTKFESTEECIQHLNELANTFIMHEKINVLNISHQFLIEDCLYRKDYYLFLNIIY